MRYALLIALLLPTLMFASSHREAPLIAEDPTMDNTDVYVFRSPDNPNTVTIIANYIPLEEPAGGPNFYNFSPAGVYEIVRELKDGRPVTLAGFGTLKPGAPTSFNTEKSRGKK